MLKYIYKLFIFYGLIVSNSLAQSCTSTYEPYFNGTCMAPARCKGALINNKCPDGKLCCIEETDYVEKSFVSSDDLKAIVSRNNSRIDFISKVLTEPTSNPSCSQKAFFISQLAYESEGFMISEEPGDEEFLKKKYEEIISLGNINRNEGAKYRGRGFIFLTGRTNYENAGNDLGIPLLDNPELAAFPSVAAKIAVWYWQKAKDVDLNSFADGTFYGFSLLTEAISGGINGLNDRTKLLESANEQLRCGFLLKGRGEACKINGNDGFCKPICVQGLRDRKFCGCNGDTRNRMCSGPQNIRCCVEECSSNMDLAFLIDSSGSIQSRDFIRALEFVENAVNIETYLNTTHSKDDLIERISMINHMRDVTFTGEALNEAFKIYSSERGMRDSSLGVGKIIIVLTDGQSNGLIKPIPVADALRQTGISIISVGVGPNLNFEELIGISGGSSQLIRVDDYQKAALIFYEINQLSCLQPATIPASTNPIEVGLNTAIYFSYPINNTNETKSLDLTVIPLAGDVQVFSSFTNQNPNDFEVADMNIVKRSADNTYSNVPLENSTYENLYIGVKGLTSFNQFKIEIRELNYVPRIIEPTTNSPLILPIIDNLGGENNPGESYNFDFLRH
ncbi:chitinase [Brachionus plicatilis]|uniref:Chitinase n=1 Tax=Brachionus plicatilis TaxID=10195 RepID=A0A3M7QQS0_BRAPC|nr:chitinase [Brachionus plicatilis]